MADITIIIQAASDSIMTENGSSGGIPLEEGDARKVYGLPNITSTGLTGTFFEKQETAKITWIESPRWDEIKPPDYQGPTFLSGLTVVDSYKWAYSQSIYSGDMEAGGRSKPNPTTTPFQLRCENISHEFTDNVMINPIPAFDVSPGQHDNAGTPGQLNMIVLALGMRTEIIKLSGMLVDRGLVTASNPRRQILLNIARMQHYKTGRGGQGSGEFARWGGGESGLLNPRSYPCLRIFRSYSTALKGFSMGQEPSGDSRQYRGIIKDLSFRMEGGRPDHWFWNMTFAVIANEHSPVPLGQSPWLSKINRIRLVDDIDGTGSAITNNSGPTAGDGFFEIRCKNDLVMKDADGEVRREMKDGDMVYISGTQTVPTVNGFWKVQGIRLSNRTFVLIAPVGNEFGEKTAVMNNSNNEGDLNQLEWNFDNFTAADDGHVSWGTVDYSGQTGEVKS